jgi:putative transposase
MQKQIGQQGTNDPTLRSPSFPWNQPPILFLYWRFQPALNVENDPLDFVHDAVECGRAIRVLSVVDAYARECLALEVDTSFASRRVTRVLDGIVAERGRPLAIRCDNGPELTSRHFLAWCVERKIELLHLQPGKPTQNARVESFHGRLREECLTVSWFQNLFDARRKIAAWRKEYNEERPHSSLGYRTPKEFAVTQAAGFYTAEREARDSNWSRGR